MLVGKNSDYKADLNCLSPFWVRGSFVISSFGVMSFSSSLLKLHYGGGMV